MARGDKEDRAALISYFTQARPDWRFMITIGGQRGQGNAEEVEKRLGRFLRRLSIRTYGTRRFNGRKIKHITVFESRTKAKNQCELHSHSVIAVESSFLDRFKSAYAGVACSMDFKDIDMRLADDPQGAISYISKNIGQDNFCFEL